MLADNVQDKAAAHGGSAGSMSRGSPLLAGMSSAKPAWQGSPQKSAQSAGTNSELISVRSLL